ncbi:MAG: procyclic acidic repetitive family protein [Lachnospiraceae bacterium]|nr:procyclic acidic repetitive family protein [Lachnospiraceae bacterium]
MKKIISVLMILVMVMALAACGKKETPSDPGNEVTQAAKNETEPTKAAETTPEPTKEATPEPTKEVTPEPTAEPTAEPDPEPDVYSGDVGDGFGAEFTLWYPAMVDVFGSTFCGVYCECWDFSTDSYSFPYNGDEMSIETMDEINAAYLTLGETQYEAHFCFLEKGINIDVNWEIGAGLDDNLSMIDDDKLFMTDTVSGEVYEGLFYFDDIEQKMYVSVRVDEYDVWMVWMGSDFNNDEVIAKSQALEAIQNYLNDAHPELAEKLKTGENDTAIGTYDGDDIEIWVRTDTGSIYTYSVDKISGDVSVWEIDENGEEWGVDETLNVWDYLN